MNIRKCNWRKRANLDDLQDKRFGKLIVVKAYFDENSHQTLCDCKCDCGNLKIVKGGLLIRGLQTSCGCGRKDFGSKRSIWKGEGEISGHNWGRIERCAKRRKIPFEITIKDGWNQFLKQDRKCALSGEILSFNKKADQFVNRTVSLDRIDSSKGYIKGNIQWVHKDVNMMKQSLTEEKFIEWCQKISKYRLPSG